MFDRDKAVGLEAILGINAIKYPNGRATVTEFMQLNEFLSLSRVISENEGHGYNVSGLSGLAYHVETPIELIKVVDRLHAANRHLYSNGFRVRVWYGDRATGQAWGDIEIGRISNSTGPIKIPWVINNRRSMGGSPLLDHCIVRIDRADIVDGWRWVLCQHPQFNLSENADQWVLDRAN